MIWFSQLEANWRLPWRFLRNVMPFSMGSWLKNAFFELLKYMSASPRMLFKTIAFRENSLKFENEKQNTAFYIMFVTNIYCSMLCIYNNMSVVRVQFIFMLYKSTKITSCSLVHNMMDSLKSIFHLHHSTNCLVVSLRTCRAHNMLLASLCYTKRVQRSYFIWWYIRNACYKSARKTINAKRNHPMAISSSSTASAFVWLQILLKLEKHSLSSSLFGFSISH